MGGQSIGARAREKSGSVSWWVRVRVSNLTHPISRRPSPSADVSGGGTGMRRRLRRWGRPCAPGSVVVPFLSSAEPAKFKSLNLKKMSFRIKKIRFKIRKDGDFWRADAAFARWYNSVPPRSWRSQECRASWLSGVIVVGCRSPLVVRRSVFSKDTFLDNYFR